MEQTLITALITVSLFFNLSAHAAGKTNAVIVNPPVPAPDWTLPAIENAEGNLSMSDFRGKITYVDFGRLGAVPVACHCLHLTRLMSNLQRSQCNF